MSEATAAAADHSKVGSCLLQAGSTAAAREGTLARALLQASSARDHRREGTLAEGAQLRRDLLVSRQPSDDIPNSFFQDVKKALDAAARTTPEPKKSSVVEDQSHRPGFGQWDPLKGLSLKKPWVQGWNNMWKDEHQPLNTRIGAALLYDFSVDESTLERETPPPTQGFVNSQFQSSCPMVLFTNELEILPPLCNQSVGSWIEHGTDQKEAVLRWEKRNFGVHFGADSSVHGVGSVGFAKIEPEATAR